MARPPSLRDGRHKGKPCFIEVLIPKRTGWESAEERSVCPACFSGPPQALPTQTSLLNGNPHNRRLAQAPRG
jgi:hypothetical protein